MPLFELFVAAGGDLGVDAAIKLLVRHLILTPLLLVTHLAFFLQTPDPKLDLLAILILKFDFATQ